MESNNIQSFTPATEEEWLTLRQADITSTEVSALFGLSPYTTLFELWHHKKNNTRAEFNENTRTQWGNRLEDAIARGIAEDQGWSVRPMKEYVRQPALRMGSSFDYSIEGYAQDNSAFMEPSPGKGILEIKNVDGLQFKNNWLKDEEGNLEAPTHIELQVQHQMGVSGRSFAYIGALVGGNEIKLIHREADQQIQQQIRDAVTEFWRTIDANEPPAPDFTRDADFIGRLFNHSEPNKVIEVGQGEVASLAQQYYIVSNQLKQLQEQKDAIKAQILMNMQDAEKVIGPGFTISAGMVGPSTYTVNRTGYRNFRLYTKKEA